MSCLHERKVDRYLGQDPVRGRFADVHLQHCPNCGLFWLSYQFEFEAFSESGRWYRAEIPAHIASTVTSETAAAVLEALPCYETGGGYFGGVPLIRSGPLA